MVQARSDLHEGVGVDPWGSATQVATQLLDSGQVGGADARKPNDPTIGKPVGSNTWELFVSCQPADALGQQFDLRSPYFIVLHDMDGHLSRKFLMEVAHRLHAPVQKLVIRRQGYGNELATMYFFDLKASNGEVVRVYSADSKADDEIGARLRRVLITRSRMCVVTLGTHDIHDTDVGLAELLQTLRDRQARTSSLVFVPVAESPTLTTAATAFTRQVIVPVYTAPLSRRPLDALPFLVTTWNKLHAGPRPETPKEQLWLLNPEWAQGLAQAPVSKQSASPVLREDQLIHLGAYAKGVGGCPGVQACCIFNVQTLVLQARAGSQEPSADVLVKQGRAIIASMQASSIALGLGQVVREGVVKLADHALLLRLIRGAPNMLLMTVLHYQMEADLIAVKNEIARQDRFFWAALGRPTP